MICKYSIHLVILDFKICPDLFLEAAKSNSIRQTLLCLGGVIISPNKFEFDWVLTRLSILIYYDLFDFDLTRPIVSPIYFKLVTMMIYRCSARVFFVTNNLDLNSYLVSKFKALHFKILYFIYYKLKNIITITKIIRSVHVLSSIMSFPFLFLSQL